MNRDLVRLRPVGLEDVDDILGWVNDRQIVGNLASFSGQPFSRADEVAYVQAMMASEVDRVFSVLAADDGRYLGQIGIHQIFWRSRVGRLSLVIASKDEWGKGFGSAAIARILDVAFRDETLHKVWLMVFRTNERSRRTYERAGFAVEGTLREEYFHDGAWHDMVRMSMLTYEWT